MTNKKHININWIKVEDSDLAISLRAPTWLAWEAIETLEAMCLKGNWRRKQRTDLSVCMG